jgi:aminoglycoside phosphotransferase (APT) family kinase protein
VVRIYARDPARAAIDASLLRLVRGLLPVPAVLELRHPTAGTPAVLVTEYVAGQRLDVALAGASCDLERVGRSVGAVLAALAGMPFLHFAMFADGDLTLSTDQLPGDLRVEAEHLRAESRLSVWPDRDWDALLDLIDLAEALGDNDDADQRSRAVLTHSDLNPKNLLIDPATSQVVAVLDWEFAHAGSPHTDLGNFCRFERDPRLIEPLLDVTSGDLTRARAADLWALLELASRPLQDPVPALATELLLAQARAGDLHAWPWTGVRISPPVVPPAGPAASAAAGGG